MLIYSGIIRTNKCRLVGYIFDRSTVPIILQSSTFFSLRDVGSTYQTVRLCGRLRDMPVSFSSTQQFVLQGYDCLLLEGETLLQIFVCL
jgi:hypothetical protein